MTKLYGFGGYGSLCAQEEPDWEYHDSWDEDEEDEDEDEDD